ncbi:MAG: hypothetical protein NVSMB23_21500 [Myxococcales bacterium]
MGGQSIRQAAAGPAPASPELSTLFAPGELRDYGGFVLRSLRRRRGLAVSTALVFGAATAGLAALLPRSYHVETRLFAMPEIGAPGALRSASDEALGLAQGAAEVVVADKTLLEIVRDKDLVARWKDARTAPQRWWDRVGQALSGRKPAGPGRAERALVAYLTKKLTVQVKGTQIILGFDWPEARTAVEVVQLAEQKLLAARREAELVPLERRVAALQVDAAAAQGRIDAAIAGIETATKGRRRGARSATVRGLQAEGRFRDLPDAALAGLRLQLVAARKSIAELEDARRKHFTDLQAALAEQRATLGPGHPALLDTQEKLRALERQGSQLDAMKAQEQELLGRYVRAGGKEIELSAEPAPAWPLELKEDDQAVAYGKARIAMELSTLQHLLAEGSAAQVALASARATFDNRYVVVAPAELPERPTSPSALLLLLAGLLGGILVAVFGAVASDLRGGVVRERWQVDRLLGLPVLAEVPQP